MAIVLSRHRHTVALAFEIKEQAPAVRHGIQRVDEQVQERLVQFLRDARYRWQRSPVDADLIRDAVALRLGLPPRARLLHLEVERAGDRASEFGDPAKTVSAVWHNAPIRTKLGSPHPRSLENLVALSSVGTLIGENAFLRNRLS